MKENKSIEKELLFKNKIKEITSISLDSDYRVENGEIVGNFLINGEYKIHEISINREKFNFKIPFKHDIYNNIDPDTIKLEISNFLYDYKQDELIVNIEYELSGDRKDVMEFDDERSLDEFLSNKELEVIDTRIDDIKKEIDEEEKDNVEEVDEEENRSDELDELLKINEEELEEIVEDNKEIDVDINPIDDIGESEDRDEINADEIMGNINNIDDKFVTYKVVKLTEADTLESLVVRHRTTLDELKEYNDLTNIKVNDKIIIPDYE